MINKKLIHSKGFYKKENEAAMNDDDTEENRIEGMTQ
ncbi:hypothetical protein ACN92M_26075 (plasmid) [Paenibacillus polymyxa]